MGRGLILPALFGAIMANSKVEICNRALLVIGSKGILSVDQDEKAARDCDLAYDPMRRALLEEGEWTFATKRAELSRLNETPIFQFDYAYAKPSDALRIQKVYSGDFTRLLDTDQYVFENGKILTDEISPLYAVYTKNETDPRMFSEMFAEALAYRIALYIQPNIVESDSKQAYLEQKYVQTLRAAKAHDSMNKSDTVGFYSSVILFKE